MPETRKMPNAKFPCQPLSKNAKFEEFGTKNAKLTTLLTAETRPFGTAWSAQHGMA